MHNEKQEWDAVAAQWTSSETWDPSALIAGVARKRRRRQLGLVNELLGTVLALGLIAWALMRPATSPSFQTWLIGAGGLIVLVQLGYFALRRYFNVFKQPETSLLSLIDADMRHDRFVLAYLWSSALGGLFILIWAYLSIPQALDGTLSVVLLSVALFGTAYLLLRTVQLRRRLRQMRAQRRALH